MPEISGQPNACAGSNLELARAKQLILIVDDEQGIRCSLEGILQDEGYETISCSDGNAALQLIQDFKVKGISPALVFLDIWLPGLDGLETLKRLKEISPAISVIMISGHATIATAISATRFGATDFIEKPLDLETTLAAVRRALGVAVETMSEAGASKISAHESNQFDLAQAQTAPEIESIVFQKQNCRGQSIPQRTIARSAILYGQGLHSGKKSGLILEPLPPNSGIHFVGVSDSQAVPALVDYVGSTGWATTVRLGQTKAGTIEHLMSALHAYGISNLLIKCNGEVPVLDGSAREFCALFDEVGLEEQVGDWYEIAIDRVLRVGNEREWMQLEPAEGFSIDYTLSYPKPVGEQRFCFELGDAEAYKREIAPARTFGFVKDIGALQRQGLALGGRFDNFVLFGESGPINDALRFPDEPVRHKILDAIGDLYLLGRRIRGKVTAHLTGHSDNIALLKLVRAELNK